MAALVAHQLFRGSGDYNVPALFPALGPEIDQVIRALDDVEIVFNDDYGVAEIHKFLEHIQ